MTPPRIRSADPPLPPFAMPAAHVVVEIKADPARPGGRLVLQDGVESSYVDVRDPSHLEFEYLRHLARVVDVMHPKRLPMTMAQVGGGPCAFARYLEATRKDLRATVIERDATVIDIAREWLGLRTSATFEVVVGDGREALASMPDGALDILVVDAFDGVVVPHHLSTTEFAGEARRAVRQDGIHLINLIDLPPLGLAVGIVAGMREHYANVALLADDRTLGKQTSGNLVIVGTDRDIATETLARLAARDPEPWELVWGKRLDRLVGDAAPLRDDVPPQHTLAMLGSLWGRASSMRRKTGVET